ncbi:hypothetical protein LINGRAHAP2_LOCUS19336 [Linum grandiflorum]
MINGSSRDLTEFGVIIAVCQKLLQDHSYYMVTWIMIYRNKFADELARQSRNLVFMSIFLKVSARDDL